MRDPARISKLLQALEEAWHCDPDCRLGQLIVGATNFSGRKVVCPEVFYLEDEDMLRGIEEFVARRRKEKA